MWMGFSGCRDNKGRRLFDRICWWRWFYDILCDLVMAVKHLWRDFCYLFMERFSFSICCQLSYWNGDEQWLMTRRVRRDYGVWKSAMRAISICVKSIVKWSSMQLSRATCHDLSTTAAVPTPSCKNGNDDTFFFFVKVPLRWNTDWH